MPKTSESKKDIQNPKGCIDICDASFVGYLTLSPKGIVEEVNLAAAAMLHSKREWLIGVPFVSHVAPHHQKSFFEYLCRCGSDPREVWAEFGLKKGSSPVGFLTTAIQYFGGPVLGYCSIMTKVQDRRKAQQEMERSRPRLRHLAARLQTIREEERATAARYIHDELGQYLTALKIEVDWLFKRLSCERPPSRRSFKEKLSSIQGLVETMMVSVRGISEELRPPVLDKLGLSAAIEWQTEEFQKRTGIRCRFENQASFSLLDSDRTMMVFRIFQETLTNVARHAGATEIEVRLKNGPGLLILEVQDNGRGIGDAEIASSRSFGILGMRERALAFGGQVSFKGKSGFGTTVTAEIPIQKGIQ